MPAPARLFVRNEHGSIVWNAYIPEPDLGYDLPPWVTEPLSSGRWTLERRDLAEPPPEARDGFSPPNWKEVAEGLHEALVQVRTEADQICMFIAEATDSELVPELDERTVEQVQAAIDRFDVACMAYAELHPESPDSETETPEGD